MSDLIYVSHVPESRLEVQNLVPVLVPYQDETQTILIRRTGDWAHYRTNKDYQELWKKEVGMKRDELVYFQQYYNILIMNLQGKKLVTGGFNVKAQLYDTDGAIQSNRKTKHLQYF